MDQGLIASLLQHPLTSALAVLDTDGRPLACNRAAQAMGLAATLQAYRERLAPMRESLAHEGGQVPCVLPGDGEQMLDASLRAVQDGAGHLLAYTVSVPDALGEHGANRWEIAVESAGHGLWDWDIASDRTHRSARWAGMLGYAPDQVPRNSAQLFEMVHPDDRERLRDAIGAHLDGATDAYACEFRLRQHDGDWRWVLDRGQIVSRHADGRPLRMIGTHTDIQESKLQEQQVRDQQALLHEAQRIASMGSWSWDITQGQLWWSQELQALVGIDARQVNGLRAWLRHLSRESAVQFCSAWRRMRRDGHVVDVEVEIVRDREAPLYLRIWAQPVFDGLARVQRVLGQVQNVTVQRQTDALIRWRTELLNRVSALGKIGGCEIELGTRRMQWTEECYRIHGLRKIDITLDEALQMYTQDSRDAFEAALVRIAEGGLPEQLELCFYRHSGQRVWVQVLVELDEREGLPARFVVLLRDVTQEREASERIELLAHYDLLTGLPNRFLLREQAEEAMLEARERGTTLAMLLVDLDGFKSINDSFGHATGDTLLKLAAGRLHQNLRNNDLFGRFSDDEFVVLLRDLSAPEDAGHVARKLIAALAEPLHTGDKLLKVGASVGIALQDEALCSFDNLLRAADAAMYAAKESGRNTYHYYSQDVLARAQRRLEIEHALHGAIDREEFSLVYQPLVNVNGKRAPGIEALVRWHRPGQGYCSPAEFIPIAEQCGEIERLGEWVLGEACRQAAAWLQAGVAFDRISVNVSAVQFRDRDFGERVVALCRQHGLAPERLELELTESALIRDSEPLRRCFDMFEQHGILLAVDDFGTGFSNLHYLNRFPVQRLKIDRSFVQEMLTDAGTAEVTQAIIHLGHALGMEVVAEGVENVQEQAMLLQQGCDEIQGYLHARPLPPRELVQWMRERLPLRAAGPVLLQAGS